MKLYTPEPTAKKRYNWCGPYALAVLFDTSYDRAYDMACQWTKRRKITGMWNSEMLLCIERHNREVKKQLRVTKVDATEVYNYESQENTGERRKGRGSKANNKTLTQWYNTRRDKRGTYLVQITGHYVVISGGNIIDNNSKKWEPFHDRRKHKRSLVRNIFQIELA